MAQEAGTVAGAPREAAPSAYGGIEPDRLVVLAKPRAPGAGYCTPFAVVRFQDLPEELRRQIAGASGHGAAAPARPRDPNAALPPAAAAGPLRGEGDARLPVDVVLPGLVSGPNRNDEPTFKFAGVGSSDAVGDYSAERRILRLMEEDAKVVAHLDASGLDFQGLGVGDMERSLLEKEEGLAHAWMGHTGGEVCPRGPKYKVVANGSSEPSNMAANGLRAREDVATAVVALLLGNDRVAGPRAIDGSSDGVAPPREDAVPFVETLLGSGNGNGRATEQGVYYYDDDGVLVPPENVAPAARPPTYYAVQVRVDAAAGGKAGDPIASGVKEAAGADAGREHGGSLSAVLGIVVASSAATALAAGTVGPAAAFGLFAALVGGLSLAMASVRGR